MAKVRTLTIEVYRSCYGDCSLDGISSKYNLLEVAMPDGPNLTDENDPRLVKIIKRNVCGSEYLHIEPYKNEGIWFMAGGNMAYTCDSRFRSISPYPLSIHDRDEYGWVKKNAS